MAASPASADEVAIPHVKVTWCSPERQARALAETLAAAREVYVDELGFDMPEVLRLSVICGVPTELFNDGQDMIFLSLASMDALAPPAKSGVSNIYGMCHELGHIAMYRALKDRDWITNAAAEGWAHYIGSVVVDRVFAAKGESLWPEPYDYRKDGTARLEKDLASNTPSEEARGAAQWRKLEPLIGLRGFAKLFAAWQAARIDPVRPSAGLLNTLINLDPQRQDALSAWWKEANPVLVEQLQVSEFALAQAAPSALSGQPVKLVLDRGSKDGQVSIAGGGHGRKFTAPSEGDWYITAVWFYGQRYGPEKAPDTTFDIGLCDQAVKLIALWKKPYALFEREQFNWVRMEVPPTRVPKTFYVCLNFRPTGSNGVYAAFDSSTKGNSVSSPPGKPPEPFKDGDWMIRVELDQKK
jgi:hypothetical protein